MRLLRPALLTFVLSSCAVPGNAQSPDFGSHVIVFDAKMPTAEIQQKIDAVYAQQKDAQFGKERYALLFKPGHYNVNVPVGFYTQVLGLGSSPDAVAITGDVRSNASLPKNNATCDFWREAEGFSVTPTNGPLQWAVSQAISFRRMHVRGDMVLHQHRGWASGGWMSDTVVDGNVDSGSQQQWISRNVEWKNWTGLNWNMVFVGVNHPPEGDWPEPPYTRVTQTPVIREKPYLTVDASGRYSMHVPSLRTNSSGVTWHTGETPGRSIPLNHFYLAHAGVDTAASMNAQLAKGIYLLLTPGIYDLTEPLRVTKAGTVVYGMGLATLHPTRGTAAMTTADADGIVIAGLLFDAGAEESPVLLRVGEAGSHADHAKDPISLHDVFFRVGGAGVGKAIVSMEINNDDTLIDHTWLWRADHGEGVGWDKNTARNGLVVNGDRVTAYGLFAEHYQQYQVLWNGEHGRTYFYQSEIPYDPPTQSAWSSAPGVKGWASYKVADRVRQHEAWGLGIYSVFIHPDVYLSRAIEVPDAHGVRFHHMITVRLLDKGEILNVINGTGGSTRGTPQPRITPQVTDYPAEPSHDATTR
jgi:hypothetical protein